MKTILFYVRICVVSGLLALPLAASAADNNIDNVPGPLITKGAVWQYWPGLEAPAAEWNQPDFNSADWPAGPAQLGYGDGDEATVLYGEVPAAERPITAYFRKTFNVADKSAVLNLLLSVLRDDGVVIYLNGVEVHRNNLPPGPISSQTLASTSINHDAEKQYVTVQLPAALAALTTGDNVLAVEVHQVVAGSLDLSFDLQLTPNSIPVDPEVTGALIAKQSIWQYLDDGSDQGTAWRMPAFDDSAWRYGKSPLGYANGNENTIVSYGADPEQKHITTYFRKAFYVADPAAISNLVARVLRDDGAATYLNGVQITRGNLPSGAHYQTLARSSVNGLSEKRYYQANVNPALLVAGRNVLAAEVHQVVPSSADLSFDFELLAIATPPNQPPLVNLFSPAPGQSFAAPAQVRLAADVTAGSSSVLWIEFFADGKLVGRDTSAPYEMTWENVPASTYTLHATATDAQRNVAASTPVTITVVQPENLLPQLSLLFPREGAAFVAPAQVGIILETFDPDGLVASAEFFANGVSIGFGTPVYSDNNPNSATFSLVWTEVPAGEYAITAQATDERGAIAESQPARITVSAPGTVSVVNVAAPDRVAIEGTTDTATFVINRHGGDQAQALVVHYTLTGRAENGVDYQTLPTQAEIPAGAESVTVEVIALADNLAEGGETVYLNLQADANGTYLVGPAKSVSVFTVEPPPPLPGANGASALAGVAPTVPTSILSVQFLPAGTQLLILGQMGQNVVIEASTDLDEWVPIATLPNSTGIIEFTDPSAPNFKQSYYRVVSE